MEQRLFDLIQGAAGLLFLVWLSVLAWKWSQRAADMRHELRMRVLERFSSEEFVALLQTEGGRKWMADVLTGRPETEHMTGNLKQAILFTFIGLALAIMSATSGPDGDILGGISVLVLMAAAGLWVSTLVVARRRKKMAAAEGSTTPPVL